MSDQAKGTYPARLNIQIHPAPQNTRACITQELNSKISISSNQPVLERCNSAPRALSQHANPPDLTERRCPLHKDSN